MSNFSEAVIKYSKAFESAYNDYAECEDVDLMPAKRETFLTAAQDLSFCVCLEICHIPSAVFEAMQEYKGFVLSAVYGDQFTWCSEDFDGADIDFETGTKDPHGSGTLEQCHEAIDELIAEDVADQEAKAKAHKVSGQVRELFRPILDDFKRLDKRT